MDGQEEVLIGRCADDIGREKELEGKRRSVAQVVASKELDPND